MEEEDFKRIIQKLVEREQLSPESAEKLLQKILKILFPKDKKEDG